MESGDFGTPIFCESKYFVPGPRDVIRWGSPTLDWTFMLVQAVHPVDWARQMMGDIATVSCARGEGDNGAISYVVSCEFASGAAGLIKPEMVRRRQVIFALSNPNPEIKPEQALEAGAAFAADGRMVNNALAFPGLFRGALSARAKCINNAMKIAAAEAIAADAEEGDLVPMLLKEGLHQRVAERVERTAFESGANRAKTT